MGLEVGCAVNRLDGLEHRLDPWRDRYPEVQVRIVPVSHGVAELVSNTSEPVQLAAIGSGQGSPADAVGSGCGHIDYRGVFGAGGA